MKSKVQSTLVISTYNWPEALELVLLSVNNQSVLPDEVIIADDGSSDETKRLIEDFKKKNSVKLLHCWQEDRGFRKSLILNKAISKAKYDYIIQLDGDCIMHEHFIRDHVSQQKNKTYLFGSRVNIVASFLSTLFQKKQIRFHFFSKGLYKRTRNIHLPVMSKKYKRTSILSSKLRGCNLSFWKKDFIAVNGYNEDMEGWGREDSELIIRMLNNGVLGKRIRYSAIVYHIYHLEKSRDKLLANDKMQQNSVFTKSTWCSNGIDKHLKE